MPSDLTKPKTRKRIVVTQIFNFDEDLSAYLNFPTMLGQMGCPDQQITDFVQTGRVIWEELEGKVRVMNIVEVHHET